MSFIREWFKSDDEKTNEVLGKCNQVYIDCKKDFEKYDSKEKFVKTIENNMTGNLPKYIKIKGINEKYTKKKK